MWEILGASSTRSWKRCQEYGLHDIRTRRNRHLIQVSTSLSFLLDCLECIPSGFDELCRRCENKCLNWRREMMGRRKCSGGSLSGGQVDLVPDVGQIRRRLRSLLTSLIVDKLQYLLHREAKAGPDTAFRPIGDEPPPCSIVSSAESTG